MENINTKDYWNKRFKTDNPKSWEKLGGESQTIKYAKQIVQCLGMPIDFQGTILDFGCAMGDAMPIYLSKYPMANYLGIDFSEEAIRCCLEKYQIDKYKGRIKFLVGNIDNVPIVDVIIISHVLEHLSNDKDIVYTLLQKCQDLYIAVPFNEKIEKGGEHINSYNFSTFDYLKDKKGCLVDTYIFNTRLNIKQKIMSFYNIEIKNILRPLLKKAKACRKHIEQIVYHIYNNKN
jgi:SAM-dependent methyltransferase